MHNAKDKINLLLQDSFMDMQGVTTGVDQSYVVKLVTKAAVGAATAFWSLIELKDYLALKKKLKS